jgi:ribonuclease BN (tRNA processing enzyme)
MADQPKQNKLNIELPEDISEGTYSNLAIISHSHSEFILDFVRILPNVPKAKVKSRVILTPTHAKRLLKALNDNIQKYEAQFGDISGNDGPPMPPMSFNTPKAEA